jgi:hypothetical protein
VGILVSCGPLSRARHKLEPERVCTGPVGLVRVSGGDDCLEELEVVLDTANVTP